MIHDDNPFSPADEDRLKRFRGRLAAPVTIITSGNSTKKTALTVSSLFVVEGEPPLVYAAVGPNSDLFDYVAETGKFVVHVCREGDEGVADVFAGLRPSPGGIFANVEWDAGDWGPTLADLGNRAFCTTLSMEEKAWSGILVGAIDRIEVSDLTSPLVHFRGAYRRLYARR